VKWKGLSRRVNSKVVLLGHEDDDGEGDRLSGANADKDTILLRSSVYMRYLRYSFEFAVLALQKSSRRRLISSISSAGLF
jgi:hypothetical protein